MKDPVAAALPRLVSADLGDPRDGDVSRVRVRPVTIKGRRLFQFERLRGAKAFHANLDEDAALAELRSLLQNFRRGVLRTEDADLRLVRGRWVSTPASRPPAVTEHDRPKSRLLPEGEPLGFLVRLGVMTPEGKVVAARRDKFRQINRYLELVDDVVAGLPPGKLRVVDFGCGRSYLTFALHHLLVKLRMREVEITGLDLKREVVEDCTRAVEELGLEGLRFETGDIAGYRGAEQADLVVSLHACDTATDAALARAVEWGAQAILAVPCCQHELARTIGAPAQAALLKHGILKDRLASLVTDALRAELLEAAGYAVQVIEFVDTEHTPKNLMIRAVRRGSGADPAAYRALRDAWNARPSLEPLLGRLQGQ
jgi:trans-aconitate methyltransferase